MYIYTQSEDKISSWVVLEIAAMPGENLYISLAVGYTFVVLQKHTKKKALPQFPKTNLKLNILHLKFFPLPCFLMNGK